ncbi:TonB-dependent receptor [Flavobacterium hankyongi]|uniref:TonB-dependent receptor n=2 Tax=Flavobacteriaceae TaxID=49546 RepID=A0ABP9A1T9_9FLAO
MQFSFAQEKTITGKVTDASGPLPGVNVVVKGTTKGTTTNFDGTYSIKAKEGESLIFSFMGMNDVVKTVGSENTINTVLSDESKQLTEVVVVGYGVQKKKDVTTSISKVKGSDIQGLVTPSFESQLAGRASGVQVATSTGIVGQAPRVRIRGVNSINGSQDPLYIVDGVPIYSGDLGGQANANGLGDINPSDIESFDILKDGAAAAIYGSRAANGVIIITTKKGKKGSMKVSYNNVVGFASPMDKFDLLKTADFITIANEKRTNRGQTPWAVGTEYDTDWQDVVLNKAALQMDHNLSLSGGSDKTRYFLSLGYTSQDGIAKANSMNRYNIRTNLDHEVSKWLTVGGSIALTKTDYSGLNTGRNSLSGNMFNAIRQLPNTPVYDASNPTGYNINLTTGNMGQWTNTAAVGDNISNIGYVLDKNKLESKIQRTLITTFASANITKDLNYKFQASVDNASTKGLLYYDPTHGDGRGSSGRLQNDQTDLLRWNLQNILSYNKTFADAHNLSATAVAEYQKERNQFFFGLGTNLISDFFNQGLISDAYSVKDSGGSINEEGIISYIGRLSYNYKQRYFLQGSYRRDGLSKFAEDKRWIDFSGVSLGWTVSNESFMAGLKETISDLKLRASYAEMGNISIPGSSQPYLNLFTPSVYGSSNGIAFTQLGNPALTWETSKKTDYGVDLGLMNDKVKVTFDYFVNDQNGLVMSKITPHSLGVPNNAYIFNVGKMQNKGFEASIDYSVINNANFKWKVNANFTSVKNVVKALPSNNADIIGGTTSDINIQPNIIVRVGESLNSLYGFEYWGVNPANGNPVYYKADGSLVQGNIPNSTYYVFNPNNPSDISTASSLTTADKKILGNTIPTYFGGFSSSFTYKNVDFGFLFRFSGGNKIFNSTRRELMNLNFNNNSTEILGRWQSPSEPGDGWTPRLWAGGNTFVNQSSNATSRFVEKGDFISLENVSLGYTLPKSLLEKINVNSIRLFVQAQNMLLITKYKGLNPEMETLGVDLNGTPRSKVFSMGVNLNL